MELAWWFLCFIHLISIEMLFIFNGIKWEKNMNKCSKGEDAYHNNSK